MKALLLITSILFTSLLKAEDGYRLWLRYDKIKNPVMLAQYRNLINSIVVTGTSQTINIARQELLNGLKGLLNKNEPAG